MELQLHRAGRRPQWHDVPAGKRSAWQRTAAATGGLVTPGNICTALGFGLVAAGLAASLQGAYGWAFVLVVVGRLLDIADGYLADVTATKSPLGEKFDAGIDKLETVVALPVLVVAGVVPVWLALVVAAPHVIIAALATYGLLTNGLPHPSRAGKLSMALAWIGLGLLLLVKALQFGTAPAAVVAIIAIACLIASLLLSIPAIIGYARAVGRSAKG